MKAVVLECGTDQRQLEECLTTDAWLTTPLAMQLVQVLLLLSMVIMFFFTVKINSSHGREDVSHHGLKL